LAGRDTAVTPGDDFYAYADGTYVKNLQIPPDRARFGNFDALSALSEDRLHTLLDKASGDSDPMSEPGKVGAFYRAYLDEHRTEALGARPLAPELAQIRAADSRSAIAALMGRGAKSFFGSVFETDIGVDAKDPQHYAVYLGQGGLGLPDRDYYLEPSFAAQKAAYQAYVAQMLHLADWPDADAQAQAIVEMETQIAKVSWTIAQDRDADQDLQPDDAGRRWPPPRPASTGRPSCKAPTSAAKRVVVAENTALPAIAKIFAATPVQTLQAWEAFNVVDSAAPYLSHDFVDARFQFRNKTLSGQPELRPRWKRAVRRGRTATWARRSASSTSPPTSPPSPRPRWRPWSATSARR
jgi:putative endopeptidase